MKKFLFLLPMLSGCETTQIFSLPEMVQAIGLGLDLAVKFGWLVLPGVTV